MSCDGPWWWARTGMLRKVPMQVSGVRAHYRGSSGPRGDKSLSSFCEKVSGSELYRSGGLHWSNTSSLKHTDWWEDLKRRLRPISWDDLSQQKSFYEANLTENKLHLQGDCCTRGLQLLRWFTHMVSHSSNACLTCLQNPRCPVWPLLST